MDMDLQNHQNIEKTISQIQIIPDEPLEKQEELMFGHKEITQTLKNIVQNTNNSTTIGFFGSWGTGKSSIINALRQSLQKEKKPIPTIIFDVWKHQDDALRRTFLHECVEQLQDQKQISKDKKVSDRVSKIVKSSVEIPKLEWKSLTIPTILVAIIAIGLLVYSYLNLESHEFTPLMISELILVSIIYVFLYWLPKNMQFLIGKDTIQFTENRFSDPAEFEKEFIEKMGETKNDKIVIAFDNLDRVIENKAVEVLSTIKTFLEPKAKDKKSERKIIFLIPCDNNAIQKQIKNVYFSRSNETNNHNSQDQDSEEFLNKFFNCTVTVPDFIPSEFETYTLSLLDKSKIPEFQGDNQIKNDVAWIIVQAYRNNPRRLIHFINSLSAYYIHISNRILSGEFDPDFLEKNLPQIAKYLVIEKKYPEYLQEMKQKGYGDPQKYAELDSSNLNDPKKAEFQRFIHTTHDIEIDNIYLFSHRRLSESEKKFPGIQTLFHLMEQEDREGLLEYLNTLQISEENEHDFSNALKDELEKKKIQQSKASFINSLLYIKANKSIEYKPELYVTIYNKIEENYEILRYLSPHLIFGSLIQPKQIKVRVKAIVNHWIDEFPRYELPYLMEILDLIFQGKLEISDQKKETYFKNLQDLPLGEEEIVSKICALDFERQNEYLNKTLIEKMIDNGILVKPEGDLSRLNHISPHIVSASSIYSIEDRLNHIREGSFDNLDHERKQTFIREYTNFLRRNTENYEQSYKGSQRTFIQFINNNIQFFQKTPYESLPIVVELAIITDKCQIEQINQTLRSRIIKLLSNNIRRLQTVLDAETIKRIYKLDKTIVYKTTISDRKEGLFAIFYKDLEKNAKEDLLDQAFKFDVHYGLNVYNILKREQPETIMTPESLRICLDYSSRKPQEFNHTDRTVILKICNETKCFDDPGLKKEYVNLMKILLVTTKDQKQKTDYISILQEDTFLLPEDIRTVIKDIHTK